jgi:hypothetical protein
MANDPAVSLSSCKNVQSICRWELLETGYHIVSPEKARLKANHEQASNLQFPDILADSFHCLVKLSAPIYRYFYMGEDDRGAIEHSDSSEKRVEFPISFAINALDGSSSLYWTNDCNSC